MPNTANHKKKKKGQRRRSRIRRIVWNRDNMMCVYCRRPLDLIKTTLDHYIPLSAGGSDSCENIRACCEPCNRLKADTDPRYCDIWRVDPV